MRVLVAALLVCLSGTAGAQIGLPPVRVPALPPVNVPGVLTGLPGTADAATAQLDSAQLRELRHARIRELLRRHRDVLEADSHGEPIVRGQLLLLSPDAASLAAVAGAGFTIERESALTGLDTRLLVLRVTGDTARALRRLQTLDPAGSYDFNHLYLESAGAAGPATPPPAAAADGAAAPPVVARLGLIDSGVDAGHGAFAGSVLHRHGCGGAAAPAPHGTAVASLLIGHSGAFQGAAPGAELYAADVFCGLPTGGSVDAVADAFAWLVGERVAVINVSLVGPPNRMLESIVRNMVARGYPGRRGSRQRRSGGASAVSGGLAGSGRRDGHRRAWTRIARGRARSAGEVRGTRRRHGSGPLAARLCAGAWHVLRRAHRRSAARAGTGGA